MHEWYIASSHQVALNIDGMGALGSLLELRRGRSARSPDYPRVPRQSDRVQRMTEGLERDLRRDEGNGARVILQQLLDGMGWDGMG